MTTTACHNHIMGKSAGIDINRHVCLNNYNRILIIAMATNEKTCPVDLLYELFINYMNVTALTRTPLFKRIEPQINRLHNVLYEVIPVPYL